VAVQEFEFSPPGIIAVVLHNHMSPRLLLQAEALKDYVSAHWSIDAMILILILILILIPILILT
jgi:hypothetical protein